MILFDLLAASPTAGSILALSGVGIAAAIAYQTLQMIVEMRAWELGNDEPWPGGRKPSS